MTVSAVKPVLKAPVFSKDFTQPTVIPESGIAAAVECMRSGHLNRYTVSPDTMSQVTSAEEEFVAFSGRRHAVAVNSCASGMLCAMLAIGMPQGTPVLTNGFTFTAVPSTILRAGGVPVLVECQRDWTIDLEDLERKIRSVDENGPDPVLLLSHMRGRIADMDRIAEICAANPRLTLIEDCAHGWGVTWKGKQIGTHGKLAAFSTQSAKVINAGEGGFVSTDDPDVAARLMYLAGCYERLYGKHGPSRPPDEACEAAMGAVPSLSVRMNELTAAVIRPQIADLPETVRKYNARYAAVASTMQEEAPGLLEVPPERPGAGLVGDHLNFRLLGATDEQNEVFIATSKALGVPISHFATDVNARWHINWRGYGTPAHELPNTDAALRHAYDLKLPIHFEVEDFEQVGRVLAHAAKVALTTE